MKTRLYFIIAFLLTAHLAFSQWIQTGSDIDSEGFGDQSGSSVSLSADGSIVAIGAPNNNDNGFNSGHVRIYAWNGMSWNQLGTDIDGEALEDQFGEVLSLSADGSIVAIGARFNNGGGSDSGHVRVYQWNGMSWNQLGTDINGEEFLDLSGYSVSLSADGSIVGIGAILNNGNGDDSGHVRIYQWDGIAWGQIGMDIDGEAAGDWSGASVSLNADGSIVAIGAIHNNGGNGHVRVYDWDGVSWNQLGGDINAEGVNDEFGTSVSLSADGSIVAIGAPDNNGGGSDSGHVRVYEWDGFNWNRLGMDIDGEAASDYSGGAISLSANGSIVAIGAIGNGPFSGHVRIYNYTPSTAIPDDNFEAALAPYDNIPGDNQVPTANIEGLITLNVASQAISDLTGIEDFIALQTLNCSDNNLNNVNLSENSNLISLDISNNPALTFLDCSTNNLTTLNLTNTRHIEELRCNGNQLASLDIVDLGGLSTLYCHDNQLTALNVTENPDLQLLHCYNNGLTGSLDLSQIQDLYDFNATNNPGLVCIQIDNPETVNAGEDFYENWLKDPAAIYSDDCSGMMIVRSEGSPKVKSIKTSVEKASYTIDDAMVMHPNPVKDELYISLPPDVELRSVSLYTMSGMEIITVTSPVIPVSGLAEGVYTVKIQLTNGKYSAKKVIIARE